MFSPINVKSQNILHNIVLTEIADIIALNHCYQEK